MREGMINTALAEHGHCHYCYNLETIIYTKMKIPYNCWLCSYENDYMKSTEKDPLVIYVLISNNLLVCSKYQTANS